MSEGVSYLGQTAHRDVILVSVLVFVFSLAPFQCGFCDSCPPNSAAQVAVARRRAGVGTGDSVATPAPGNLGLITLSGGETLLSEGFLSSTCRKNNISQD
jgi:hypothetical protein